MHCIAQNYVLHVNQGKEFFSYKRTPWKLTAVLFNYRRVSSRVSMCFMTVDFWKVLTWSSFWTQCQCMPAPQFRIAASISRTQNISQYSEVFLHPVAVWQWPFLGLLSLLSLVALFSSFFKIHFTTTATAWRYVARSRRSHASHPSQRQLHRTMTNLPLEQKQLLPTPKPTPSNSISPFPFGEGVAKLWKLGRHNRTWRHCYQQLSEMRFMRL